MTSSSEWQLLSLLLGSRRSGAGASSRRSDGPGPLVPAGTVAGQVDGVEDEVGRTVMLMGNSPGLRVPPVDEVVLPDTPSTVQWAFFAVNTEPATVTVVDVALGFEPVPPGIGDEPDAALLTVYPADRNLDW